VPASRGSLRRGRWAAVAVTSAAGQQRQLERRLYVRALPLAVLSAAVIILRFAELAK
jgi:hypothetical protein